MKKNFKPWLCLPLLTFLITSCDPAPNRVEPSPEQIEGWVPVYADANTATDIATKDPRAVTRAGKIYVKGKLLYQVEVGEGIHVIDISDGNNPRKIKFIQVIGAQEMSIKGNLLYTNNMNDLVVVDMSNLNEVKLVNRVENVFHLIDHDLPPAAGYFECIDKSKGIVVGWELKTLYSPVCRKF